MKIAKQDAILGWHWLTADRRIAHTNRSIEVRAGRAYRVRPPVVLCTHGLHASRRAIDSLEYAPGPTICRVKLWGDVREDSDKLCASTRGVIALADATQILHLFACDVAEQALTRERTQGREPDPRSWAAIEVKRRWVAGEATDGQRSAAWGAAWSVARSATRSATESAAWSVARSATRSATESVARSATRSAAWSATESAAWSVARSAAWSAANDQLEIQLLALLGLAPS